MRKVATLSFLLAVFSAGTALAWGPGTHERNSYRMLTQGIIDPLRIAAGLDASYISDMADEADSSPWHDTYEHPQWEMIGTRGYIFDPKWGNLDESRRLAFITHVAADCGVPLGHSPANQVWTNSTIEAAMEARVESWGWDMPTINPYTGTITDKLNTFYSQCISHAQWSKSNVTSVFEATFLSHGRTAGWNGEGLGLNLGQAVMLDYFLAKQPTVAEANGGYATNPGGSITFNSSGSYDPDAVTTVSGGSYYNNGTGITCSWDLNNDGTYETAGASPTLSHSQLLGLVGPTEGRTISLRVQDDEGSTYLTASHGGVATDTATIAVYVPPTAAGRAQYGWLGKPSDVPSQWDWDNLIDNGSADADHTDNPAAGVTNWEWDLNNDGVYETSGSSARVYYSQFEAVGVTANENHTVSLRVTDNEGATTVQSGISMPVLVNPILNAVGDHAVAPGNTLTLDMASQAYDPDGGAITEWAWDLNNDGTFGDRYGSLLQLTYDECLSLGMLVGSWNPFHLRVTDNDANITGWWAGTAYSTGYLYLSSSGMMMASAVPEPSSLALLATMAVSLGLWLNHRRKSN